MWTHVGRPEAVAAFYTHVHTHVVCVCAPQVLAGNSGARVDVPCHTVHGYLLPHAHRETSRVRSVEGDVGASLGPHGVGGRPQRSQQAVRPSGTCWPRTRQSPSAGARDRARGVSAGQPTWRSGVHQMGPARGSLTTCPEAMASELRWGRGSDPTRGVRPGPHLWPGEGNGPCVQVTVSDAHQVTVTLTLRRRPREQLGLLRPETDRRPLSHSPGPLQGGPSPGPRACRRPSRLSGRWRPRPPGGDAGGSQ